MTKDQARDEAIRRGIDVYGFGTGNLPDAISAALARYDQLLAESGQAGTRVPDGWVLVPKEPTAEMIRLGCDAPGMDAVNDAIVIAHNHGFKLPTDQSPLANAYRAMLAAVEAPK